jgi:hypothetical protein
VRPWIPQCCMATDVALLKKSIKRAVLGLPLHLFARHHQSVFLIQQQNNQIKKTSLCFNRFKMQFTPSLVSLLLAAASTGVQALPGSSNEQRQEAPRIYAKFWADTSCGSSGGAWVEDTVWQQDAQPLGTCIDVSIWNPTINSTSIEFNNAKHTRKSLIYFSL